MSYQEEKKEIFENILKDFVAQGNYDGINSKIKGLFFKDSNNGKLYKYCGIDKKRYTIGALKTETLYCGNKKRLNDIFELEFAYSLSSMIKDISLSTYTKIEKVVENIFEYISNENTNVSNDEKNIINKLEENEIAYKIISRLRNKNEVKTEKELQECLFYLIKLIICIMLESDVLDDSEKIHLCFSDDKIDITKIFPYTKKENNYDEKEFLQNFIRNYCDEDKQEEYLQSIENLDNSTKYLSEIISQQFNVGCLTTEPTNRLMWSHYGVSHTGICIEYDFSESFDEIGDEYFLLPVLYSKNRPQPPYREIYEGKNVVNEFNQSMLTCVITKDNVWDYENEWRIILPVKRGNKIKVPKISCIYLGVNIEEKNKKKILKIAKKKGIPVKQMKKCNSVYDLKEEDIFVP